MRLSLTTAAACAALLTQLNPAVADTIRENPVRSHPSQGEISQIDGASARLVASEAGVFVNMETHGLVPGHVYTLLMAVMNAPDQCPSLPCTPKDVLMRSDVVMSDVGYAGGAIADASGAVAFTHYQPVGNFDLGFFDNGLTKPNNSEVHLVLNDHGPLIETRALEMLTTYRGGCTEESIPGPMPAKARAQGSVGPNQCRLVQFVQFLPAEPAS